MATTPGRVGRDAAWSLAYLGAVRLATFGLSVLVARLLGSAGAGAFGIATQVATLGSLFAGMNLSAALARTLPASATPRDRRTLLSASALIVGIGGALVTLVLVAGSGWIAQAAYGDASLGPVLAASGALALGTALFVWAEGSLQGLRRFRWQAGFGVAVSIADLLTGVLAALGGLVTFLIARGVMRLVAVAAVAWRVRDWLATPAGDAATADPATAGPATEPLTRGRAARLLLGFAGPSILSNAIVLGGWAVLRLLLVRSAGLGEAGYYHVADTVAQGLLLVPVAAALAYMPAVAAAHASGRGDVGASLGRALRRVTGFNLPLCCAVAAGAPWIVALLFGAEFRDAVPAMALLAANAGLIGLASVFGATLLGRGEVWTSVGLGVVIVVIALGAYVSWFSHRGAVGAALALVLAHSVMLLCYAAIALKRWRVATPTLASAVLVNFLLPLFVIAGLERTGLVSWAALVGIGLLGVGAFLLWGLPELRHGTLRWGAQAA